MKKPSKSRPLLIIQDEQLEVFEKLTPLIRAHFNYPHWVSKSMQNRMVDLMAKFQDLDREFNARLRARKKRKKRTTKHK